MRTKTTPCCIGQVPSRAVVLVFRTHKMHVDRARILTHCTPLKLTECATMGERAQMIDFSCRLVDFVPTHEHRKIPPGYSRNRRALVFFHRARHTYRTEELLHGKYRIWTRTERTVKVIMTICGPKTGDACVSRSVLPITGDFNRSFARSMFGH